MQVGDIYTNGINYWMVVSTPEKPCECCKRPVSYEGTKCVPVMVDNNQQTVISIDTFRSTTLESIKPYVYLAYKTNYTYWQK